MAGRPAHPPRFLERAPFDGAPRVLLPGTAKMVRPCRWCGTPVPPPKQTWCSRACLDEYFIRSRASSARQAVRARDHGVCALCGLDTVALERWLDRLRGPRGGWRRPDVTRRPRPRRRRAPEFQLPYLRGGHQRLEPTRAWCGRPSYPDVAKACGCRYHRAARDLRRRGFSPGQAMWEADHVVPVVEGGGSCGLEGLRTLCSPCHKRETAELARRRARARRGLPVPLAAPPQEEQVDALGDRRPHPQAAGPAQELPRVPLLPNEPAPELALPPGPPELLVLLPDPLVQRAPPGAQLRLF